MMNSRFTTIKLSGKTQSCEPLRRFKISSLPKQGNSRAEQTVSVKTVLNPRDRLEQRSVDLDMRLLTSTEENSKAINTLVRPQLNINQLIRHRRRDCQYSHIKYPKTILKLKTKKQDEKERRRIEQIKSDYHLKHRQQSAKKAIESKDVSNLIRNFLEKEKQKKKRYHSMVNYQPEIIKVVEVIHRRVNLHFETTFGVEPQFHKLKTIYAQTGILSYQRHYCPETYNSGSIPLIPLKEDLQIFIENYQTLGKQFDLGELSRRSNFYVEYSSGELYFGQMEDLEKEGLGVLLNLKTCFEGLFQRGNKKKGYEIDRKGVYRGEFIDNQRSGIGEQNYRDGSCYSGGFKNNLRHGEGSWSNQQETYTGVWRKDKFHGYGVLKQRCGQYKGTFVNGKKQGWGREQMEINDYYEGYFFNNLPHDKGIYVWSNGTRYEGEFFNGVRTGQGTLSTVDGCVYNGSFTDQMPQGLCQIIIPESSIYKGYIKEGKKNGRGTLFLNKIEKKFDGFWQNDVLLNIIEG